MPIRQLIFCIMEQLELPDLLSCCCVCRRFFALGYRMHMGIVALDLQPFWHRVTDRTLYSIADRCTSLQSLSLSWTGGHGMVTAPGLRLFLMQAGRQLTCLRVVSQGGCPYPARCAGAIC